MHSSRFVRPFSFLLAGGLLITVLLVGCQGSAPTQGKKAAVQTILPTVTDTLIPTRPLPTLPPTWTSVPPTRIPATKTPTIQPAATATFNFPLTMEARATDIKATKCNIYPNVWQIKLSPTWKADWCDLVSVPGTLYEYKMTVPSAWRVNTFGDVFPSLAFDTGVTNVQLRLYEAYHYGTRTFEGPLKDAPQKAAFCDDKDNCTPIVGPLEKTSKQVVRNVGGKEVLVLDSQDGKYNIRRYFFFVPYPLAHPRSNRLFFFKLYTPDPVTDQNYKDLQNAIEDILITVKPQLN